jgi:hypothetical protein
MSHHRRQIVPPFLRVNVVEPHGSRHIDDVVCYAIRDHLSNKISSLCSRSVNLILFLRRLFGASLVEMAFLIVRRSEAGLNRLMVDRIELLQCFPVA